MKAVVLKCHHGYTSDRAYFVRKAVPGIGVYGGVVLNNAVGGINPFVVEAAITYGTKIVWLPSWVQHCPGRTFTLAAEDALAMVIQKKKYSWSAGQIVYISNKWSSLGSDLTNI